MYQKYLHIFIRSDQISRSVVSDSLRHHESQHTRPPCPSPTPRVHPNPRPLSQWCHPAISSSVVPFSSCPQSLAASETSRIIQKEIFFRQMKIQKISLCEKTRINILDSLQYIKDKWREGDTFNWGRWMGKQKWRKLTGLLTKEFQS